jgi:hypothetical protein
MDSLFNLWKSKIPKYSAVHKDLFDSLSAKGGAEGEKKISLGKHFSNNYELYMYAFFYGLYEDEQVPISKKDNVRDFSYAIEFWGRKSTPLRSDFTILQQFIFAALIAKTDVDMIALDKGEITSEDVVKELIEKMQAYANGGLQLIKEKLEENPNHFLPSTSFLDLIIGEDVEASLSNESDIEQTA